MTNNQTELKAVEAMINSIGQLRKSGHTLDHMSGEFLKLRAQLHKTYQAIKAKEAKAA